MSKIARKRVADAAEGMRVTEVDRFQRRRVLIAAVRNANRDGVSEYELADLAGVSRGTIRTWLGK
jgi:AcrR family transcriptional regulator